MRKLVVDFSEADDIIRKSKNALEKLYDEGENVEGAIRELSSLGGSYGEENWILNQLHEEKREIEDECNRLEKFCQKYRSFVDKVEETDERLSKKFETDIENYCKKENIEIESDLDKFLDKVGTALDVVGMIPGIGDVADAINGVLCLARGDFWGAALSFVAVIPLIGDSFKLLKYTDEAAGLLKYGDEVVNIGKGILKEGTEKASKAFKKSLENLMESGGVKKFKNALSATLDTGREFIIRGKEGVDTALTKLGMPQVFNTLCTDGCFLGDTEIETENGLRNIKYIQIGEKVLTYNEETGKIEYKEVVDKLERSTRNVCIIKTSNDTISSTTGHLFMVKDRWWVSSSSINVGDEIQTSNGTYEDVISKEIKLEGAINVTYNISLSENHTFFVGQDRILTHNTITKRECEKNLKKVLEGVADPELKLISEYANNNVFGKSVSFNAGEGGTGITYKVFQRNDIDWEMVRSTGAKKGRGLTNAEAAEKYGLAPILDANGNVATLHHSQQHSVGPLFEASTRYHNISNAKRAPLHPYKGQLNPFNPMSEEVRKAFQKVDSIEYWKTRGRDVMKGVK